MIRVMFKLIDFIDISKVSMEYKRYVTIIRII